MRRIGSDMMLSDVIGSDVIGQIRWGRMSEVIRFLFNWPVVFRRREE
jgi:hypothetical protein